MTYLEPTIVLIQYFGRHWVSCSVLKSRSDKKDVFRSNYIGLTVGTDAYKGPCTSALVQKKNAWFVVLYSYFLCKHFVQYSFGTSKSTVNGSVVQLFWTTFQSRMNDE